MKAILFLKTKSGQYLFKGDSFWSKGSEPSYAKIYSNDDIEQVNDWLKNGIMPWNIYKDKIDMVIDIYTDGILGYFTPSEDLYDNPYNLKKETIIEDLGRPTYLWIIRLNNQSEWVITKEDDESITPDTKSMCSFESYTEFHRDEVITNVLNEKDSE